MGGVPPSTWHLLEVVGRTQPGGVGDVPKAELGVLVPAGGAQPCPCFIPVLLHIRITMETERDPGPVSAFPIPFPSPSHPLSHPFPFPFPNVVLADPPAASPPLFLHQPAMWGGVGAAIGPPAPNTAPNTAPLPQSSLVLPNGDRARAISEYLSSSKKRKVEEKDFVTDYVSAGRELGGLARPHSPRPGTHKHPLPCCRAAMRTKAKTTWWWMRSVQELQGWDRGGAPPACSADVPPPTGPLIPTQCPFLLLP